MSQASHYQFLTAAGPAAIALLRISGPAVPAFLLQYVRLAGNKQHNELKYGDVERITLHASEGDLIDDAILSVHQKAPDWDVRLHLHGGLGLRKRCVTILHAAGFTQASDAYVWVPECEHEKVVLNRLPEILTEAGVEWLLRQPALHRAIREPELTDAGIQVAMQRAAEMVRRADWIAWFTTPLKIAIAGEPNAGKSTLVNALAERSVSLVSPTVGTTRDWVTASGEIDGFPVEWLDTAGLFEASDQLDQAGVAKTRALLQQADVIALAVPVDAPEDAVSRGQALLGRKPDVIARTCADRAPDNKADESVGDTPVAFVSAHTRAGLAAFRGTLLGASARQAFRRDVPVPLDLEQLAQWQDQTQLYYWKRLIAD